MSVCVLNKKYFVFLLFLIVFISFFSVSSNVFADSEGGNYPSSASNDATSGTVDWNSVNNVLTDNDSNTNVSGFNCGSCVSQYLKVNNFGFSIPSDATIDGILLEVRKLKNNGPAVYDNEVKIVKADGTFGTEDKALLDNWSTSSYQTSSYGGVSDLWNETWTPADINDPDFGAVMNVQLSGDEESFSNAQVDYMRITVYYTPAVVVVSSGGRSSSISATCQPSDKTISVGDKVSFDIDIETTEDSYTFKWTNVLEGDDEEETHTFTESGKFYPRAQAKDTDGNSVTVNCGTIIVEEDSDRDEEETTTTTTTDSPLITLLKALGIDIPSNINEILNSLSSTPSNNNTFTIDLELGDNHPEVKLLQQFLNNNGYPLATTGPGSPNNETTIFGYATQSALIKFQQANNITPAVGYFGVKTRGVVNGM